MPMSGPAFKPRTQHECWNDTSTNTASIVIGTRPLNMPDVLGRLSGFACLVLVNRAGCYRTCYQDAPVDAVYQAGSGQPGHLSKSEQSKRSMYSRLRALQAVEEAEEEVEEVAQATAKPFASLFGGKPRQAAAQAEDAAQGAGSRVKTLWGRKPKQAEQQVRLCRVVGHAVVPCCMRRQTV